MFVLCWGLLPFLLYLGFVGAVWRCWRREKGSGQSDVLEEPLVSVVVPFRNEEKHLPALVAALREQSHPDSLLEFLLVDDGSSDGGPALLRRELADDARFVLLSSPARGKKQALRHAFDRCKGSLVLTTDADCVPAPGWVAAVATAFTAQEADFLFGLVRMRPGGGLFGAFESADYMALQLSGAGAALLGMPVFCSAASMAFRRSAYFELRDRVGGQAWASGDDVFLLHAFKSAHKRIVFVKDAAAVVETPVGGSLPAYLRQRMRWGGKARAYKDGASLGLAGVVFLSNLWLLALVAGALLGACSPWWPVLAFGIKAVVDGLLLREGFRFLDADYPTGRHVLFSLFHPFLLLLTALGGLLSTPKWK